MYILLGLGVRNADNEIFGLECNYVMWYTSIFADFIMSKVKFDFNGQRR